MYSGAADALPLLYEKTAPFHRGSFLLQPQAGSALTGRKAESKGAFHPVFTLISLVVHTQLSY
jgi:hypothetical protein